MATTKYDIGDELYAVSSYGGSVVDKIKVGGISITKYGITYIDEAMAYDESMVFRTQDEATTYVDSMIINEYKEKIEQLQQEIDTFKTKIRELENAKNM